MQEAVTHLGLGDFSPQGACSPLCRGQTQVPAGEASTRQTARTQALHLGPGDDLQALQPESGSSMSHGQVGST